MEKTMVVLDSGTACTAWNYCGERLAAGSGSGLLSIYDSPQLTGSSSSFTCTSKTKVHKDGAGIMKLVWIPPDFGDAIACVFVDGSLSIWEERANDEQVVQWKLCKGFSGKTVKPLDVQFGIFRNGLKMVAAFSDGHLKLYDLLNPLELNNWQLQAEFQNVADSVSSLGRASCISASLCWSARKGSSQDSSIVVGFNSDTPQLNSPKVWDFDQAHHKWLPIAELAVSEEKGDRVFSVAWAPNIGRPFEIIAVATNRGIGIWQMGLNPNGDGTVAVNRIALLSDFVGQVCQMEWDMAGMTLASSGRDGRVRLWQCNLKGIWHQQAAFEPTL